MPTPRFLQIHTLCSFPAVLLNRDDAGLAKRLPYGGAVRTRISSQCLKRHWRKAEDEWGLNKTGADLSVRSREIFERAIKPEAVIALNGTPTAVLDAVGAAFSKALYGDKADKVRNRQALLLGWPEVHYLTQEIVKLAQDQTDAEAAGKAAEAYFKAKDCKANFSAIRETGNLTAGLEAALFGRMVTSDTAANTDAAIHVAHAFTVHEQHTETDYFTVVDDLKSREDGDDAGSAGIFDTELTSGVFYGYVVVDVPLLVSNLTGVAPEKWDAADTDRTLAAKVIEHLLHLIATVSPGAKKGSTAPYAYAQTVLVEAGSRQPRTLAAAFESPVRRNGHNASIASLAEDAMATRLAAYDKAYGAKETRCYLSVQEKPEFPAAGGPQSLDDLAKWAASCVARAEA
jgi:CRISPR system Cascade subunit CasC